MLSLEAKLMILESQRTTAGEKLARLRTAGFDGPVSESVRRLARRLREEQIHLAAGGEAGYPEALSALGPSAPRWVWRRGWMGCAGPELPPAEGCCAVVGSRRTEPRLLEAAEQLGRQLAREGVMVASGGARGADQAAHWGALRGGAARGAGGTLVIPPCGLLTMLRQDFARQLTRSGNAAWLALDHPDDPFSAGLAVRRNHVIAAVAGAVVLVASDLRGGSSYAVRWALEHRRPVFCFEAGRATSPANRSLLSAGAARALSLEHTPAQWVKAIREALGQCAVQSTPRISQAEFLLESA